MAKTQVKTDIAPLKTDFNITFSFQYYDNDSDKYCISRFASTDVRISIKRLGEINAMTFNELLRKKEVMAFHEVNWVATKEPQGFPNTQLKKLPAFQFQLLGINQQKARVFGAYSNNVFYIVWFDLNHEIIPSHLKHT